jgi:hypothetical protein
MKFVFQEIFNFMACVSASDDTVASKESVVGCEVHEWTEVSTVQPNICGSPCKELDSYHSYATYIFDVASRFS